MNTGYEYRTSPEEAVTQSYGACGFRLNPVENHKDLSNFRLLNMTADTCSVEAPVLESVFRTLPIVDDNFQRMMEPPGWNVLRMNPIDYRWINHNGFMSNCRTMPTDNNNINRESAFSMNTNDNILRHEPEFGEPLKFFGNFGETRFTNCYSGHLDINRFKTGFGTTADAENMNESVGFQVNASSDNCFINGNALDRAAVVTSIGECGMNSTTDSNAYQTRLSQELNQAPTLSVRFDPNSSAGAPCKLDSMTELVRAGFSTCKNKTTLCAMEPKVRNCQSVEVDKSYHQGKQDVTIRDCEIIDNNSEINRNTLTVENIVPSKFKKVRTARTGIRTDDVKKIAKINKLKSKSRQKLSTVRSNVCVKAETKPIEQNDNKGKLPVVGRNSTELINTTLIAPRVHLLVSNQGSYLVSSMNNVSDQLTRNNSPSELMLSITSEQKMKLKTIEPVKIDRRRKRHECKVCGKVVKKSKYLVVHMITHTGEKPYTCAVCEKRFAQQQHLKRHERIHTGEKPYVCVVCDKRFARDENLDRHILAHTKIKNYSCPVCSREFGTKGAVKSHLMIHTGEQPFKCTICSKRFRQQENMNRHMTTHTGLKEFGCTQCSKLFASKQLVKIHLISHTDVRPYVCNICKKTYKAADSLRAHTRRKHWLNNSISNKRH